MLAVADNSLRIHAADESRRPRRVLQIAFACHPDRSMECRNGWKRALHAAGEHEVTLLYGDKTPEAELQEFVAAEGLEGRLECRRVDAGPIGRRLLRSATTYYAGLRLWHRAAFRMAKKLHAERRFELIHQTTYCGYREPGYCWRLDAPFVWGPIGGTHNFPVRYLGQLTTPRAMWIELCRNAINGFQLRFSRRVHVAARRARLVLAATEAARSDLKSHLGVDANVRLETAIEENQIAEPRRAKRDSSAPLKILWSGRLRPWKALPLLLRALAILPAHVDYKLRVLGEGPCEADWKGLAEQLGIASRIEWVGWPAYRDTLPQYAWADVFAFTSLRDTSGTGLLEALAAGAPLLSVDHQGATDLVHAGCGLLVPVGDPAATIAGFARGVQELAADERLLKTLSDAALAEAHRYTWEPQRAALLDWYDAALAEAPEPARPPARFSAWRRRATIATASPHIGSSV